jgi:hypothetical protein
MFVDIRFWAFLGWQAPWVEVSKNIGAFTKTLSKSNRNLSSQRQFADKFAIICVQIDN